MFQIESTDEPTFRYRVLTLRGVRGASVIVKRYNMTHLKYLTVAQRDFESHVEADRASYTQRQLLTCLAKLHGSNYVIRENEECHSPQLALEIAA